MASEFDCTSARELDEQQASYFTRRSSRNHRLSLLVLGSVIQAGCAFSVISPQSSHVAFVSASPRMVGASSDNIGTTVALNAKRKAVPSSHDSGITDQNQPGWRRRVMSKLGLRRQQPQSLKMHTLVDDETCITETFASENFERLSPEQLFSSTKESDFPLVMQEILNQDSSSSAVKDSAEEEAVKELFLATTASHSLIGATSSFQGGDLLKKWTRRYSQSLLENMLHNLTTETPKNLQIRSSPTGNVLWGLLRGQFQLNARVDFDRMVFPFLRLSSGSVEASRMALNVLAFAEDRSDSSQNHKESKSAKKDSKKAVTPRFQSQFDFHAHDCVLTQEDLFASNCVRNGLQSLLLRILKRQGVQTNVGVVIQSIDILDNNKVAVKGNAGLVPFEIRTGLGISCRGHVLTLPGLELSLNSNFGFVPILPAMEVDLGHNFRLRDVQLDGAKKELKVSASCTITPRHTLKLGREYQQLASAFSSRFHFDVGRWLTRVGRFSL